MSRNQGENDDRKKVHEFVERKGGRRQLVISDRVEADSGATRLTTIVIAVVVVLLFLYLRHSLGSWFDDAFGQLG